MLAVVWESHGALFAVDAAEVVEVVPVVEVRTITAMPAWFCGLGDHHGRLIPILDGSKLAGSDGFEPRLGSRVLVMEILVGERKRRVGLLVEAIDEITAIEFSDRNGHLGFGGSEAPHLGAVVRLGSKTVQRFSLERFLAGERGDLIFGVDSPPEPADAATASDGPAG